ncbi:MAG: hypothetical protein ACREON_00310 [Gemmatimonadaceae bacterium]
MASPRVMLLLLTALLAACAIPLQKQGSRVTSELARKHVLEKLDANTLLATDGARCTLSERKYQEVARGDKVWCIWVTDARGAVAGRRRALMLDK